MKNLLTIVGAMIAPMILTYMCVSFVQWELNPANWSEFARFLTVMIGGPLSLMAPMFVFDYNRTFRGSRVMRVRD